MFVEYNEASWFLNVRYTCVLVDTLGDPFGKEPGRVGLAYAEPQLSRLPEAWPLNPHPSFHSTNSHPVHSIPLYTTQFPFPFHHIRLAILIFYHGELFPFSQAVTQFSPRTIQEHSSS